ncbi:hypothetical protein JCM11641_004505 [Rhodosporidiobolus odoratus]
MPESGTVKREGSPCVAPAAVTSDGMAKGQAANLDSVKAEEGYTDMHEEGSTSHYSAYMVKEEGMDVDEDYSSALRKQSTDHPGQAAVALPTPTLTPHAHASLSSFDFPASPIQSGSAIAPWGLLPALPGSVDLPALPLLPPLTVLPAVPPLRATPPSPSRSAIPLHRLIAAGTLVLPGCEILDEDSPHAEDGWVDLRKDTLRVIPQAEPEDVDEMLPPPSPPLTPKSSTSDQKVQKMKKKRKASTAGRLSPSKKAKSQHPLLDSLFHLVASLVVRATVRRAGLTVIVRVYVIPQDLPEMSDPAYVKDALRRPGVAAIFQLLNSIRASKEEWEGVLQERAVPSFLEEPDTRTLLEVYRDIESPSHDEAFIDKLEATPDIQDRLRWALTDGAEGLTTDMFPYQRATLAKMLARELAPQLVSLPAYIPLRDLLHPPQNVVVSLSSGSVRSKPEQVLEPKGGILAEDMGVGKTLITLSLVLSTLNELPKLNTVSTYLDNSSSSPPVLLTSISCGFPFPDEISEAKKLRPRVPEPLAGVEMSAKEELEYCAALAQQADQDARVVACPLPSLRSLMLQRIKTSPVSIRYPLDDPRLAGTQLLSDLQNTPPFYRVFPSRDQLDSRDGRKGAYQPTDVVVAATTLIVVPTDLVRQWVAEIDKHVALGALRVLVLRTAKDKFLSAAEMACFDVVLMSVARFSDAAEAQNTSLRGVHWRRLVVDEGHALASGNRMRKLAEELRSESRWAVSGTPSTNLRVTQDEEESALFAPTTISGGDRADLDRLGQLFARFVRHPASPKPDSLRKLAEIRVTSGGPRISRLAKILDRVVVRHHAAIIKQSFQLPPLTSRVVYIELEEAERKVYNALVALFSSNSITSQRVDQDYLFHKHHQKHLDTLTDNLQASTTFFGSTEFYWQLTEARDYGKDRLEKKDTKVKFTDDERQGLRKALEVIQEVLDDREAQLTSSAPGVAFEVEGFANDLLSPFLGLSAARNPLQRTVVSQSQLVRLRVNLKELRREDVKAWEDDEELLEEMITFEEKRKRLDAVPAGDAADMEEPLFKKRGKKDDTPLTALHTDSSFKQIRLVRTTSAKINHIVNEMLRYPDEKFIIFSSSIVDLIFANLSETLDLLGIRHAIFAGSHARSQDRGAIAQRFNTTTAAECKTILVDARLGGRGFTLTAASRVIMCESIWRADLEVQAAKRAHRLGQTRPVDLQVLVVKGTYEDALLRRRSELPPEDLAKRVKLPQQDNQLRDLLQSAQYLEPAPAATNGQLVSTKFLEVIHLVRD